MDCLKPPLQEVPGGDFICDDCPFSSTTNSAPEAVIGCCCTNNVPPYYIEAEKAKISPRSQCYAIPVQERSPGAQAN